jgi:hypothetical protein
VKRFLCSLKVRHATRHSGTLQHIEPTFEQQTSKATTDVRVPHSFSSTPADRTRNPEVIAVDHHRVEVWLNDHHATAHGEDACHLSHGRTRIVEMK